MEASNKRQTSLKIKRLVYIPKKGANLSTDSFHLRRRLPTLPLLRSTIGVTRLNFCVRDENRWDLLAIATAMVYSAFCIKAKQPEISSCCPQRTLTTA